MNQIIKYTLEENGFESHTNRHLTPAAGKILNKDLFFRPDKTKGLKCYVDADHAGGWCVNNEDDADNLYSCTGFVIKYAQTALYSGRAAFKQKLH